jgi:hypothetical protein
MPVGTQLPRPRHNRPSVLFPRAVGCVDSALSPPARMARRMFDDCNLDCDIGIASPLCVAWLLCLEAGDLARPAHTDYERPLRIAGIPDNMLRLSQKWREYCKRHPRNRRTTVASLIAKPFKGIYVLTKICTELAGEPRNAHCDGWSWPTWTKTG